MAIFYTGKRPVLKGRNSNDAFNVFKGTVGTYSHYFLFHSSHVFDGAPNRNVVPGRGNFPYGLQMSRWFNGDRTIWPLDGAGDGVRLEGFRYRPLENKSAGNNLVFKDGFGHLDREIEGVSLFDHYDQDARGGSLLPDPGHERRGVDASGTANSFGAFDPWKFKGLDVTETLVDSGQTLPEGFDNEYGRNRINEWRGVPSSEALSI